MGAVVVLCLVSAAAAFELKQQMALPCAQGKAEELQASSSSLSSSSSSDAGSSTVESSSGSFSPESYEYTNAPAPAFVTITKKTVSTRKSSGGSGSSEMLPVSASQVHSVRSSGHHESSSFPSSLGEPRDTAQAAPESTTTIIETKPTEYQQTRSSSTHAEGTISTQSKLQSSSSELGSFTFESSSGPVSSSPTVDSTINVPSQTSFSTNLGSGEGSGFKFQGQAGDASRGTSQSPHTVSTITSVSTGQGHRFASSDKFGAGNGSIPNAPAPGVSDSVNFGVVQGALGGSGSTFSQKTHEFTNAPAPAVVTTITKKTVTNTTSGGRGLSSEILSAPVPQVHESSSRHDSSSFSSSRGESSHAAQAAPDCATTIIKTKQTDFEQVRPSTLESSYSELGSSTLQSSSGSTKILSAPAPQVHGSSSHHESSSFSSSLGESSHAAQAAPGSAATVIDTKQTEYQLVRPSTLESSSSELGPSTFQSPSKFVPSAPAVPSTVNYPSQTLLSTNLGLGGGAGVQFQGQAGDASRRTSQSSHTVTTITSDSSGQGHIAATDKFGADFGGIASAPAPGASGSVNLGIGLGAQSGGSGSSFSHKSHEYTHAPAPAVVTETAKTTVTTTTSGGRGASSEILSAPAPQVHGSSSHHESGSFSSSRGEASQGAAQAAPGASTTIIETKQTEYQQARPSSAHAGATISSQSRLQSQSSSYDPLSQPWVFMMEKRFWWLRSLLQKYLRSDFPWKVFSVHPKLWLSIGGGYLRQISLNEYPRGLVWYHPEFENIVYVFSPDSGVGFWSSPPYDAWSSLFRTKEDSYISPASNSASLSSSHIRQSSDPKPHHTASQSDLKFPIAYALLSAQRPASSEYQQGFSQYLSAPAPRPSPSFWETDSPVEYSRAQLIPYLQYYNPYSCFVNRYLMIRPSQFAATSLINESPESHLRFDFRPYSNNYYITKQLYPSLLKNVKGIDSVSLIKYTTEHFRNAQKQSSIIPYVYSSSVVSHTPYLFNLPLEQITQV